MGSIVNNSILGKDICCGCGVCSAVCPKNCIEIKENKYGELRPVVNTDLCINCGNCKTVCSFEDSKSCIKDSKGKCFIGTAPDYFSDASSGGVLTYLLDKLLAEKSVDSIITVKFKNNSNEFFTYTVCSSREDLISCQGSAYYPVTLFGIIDKLKNIDGTVAIVGVPCFISALKKLKSKNEFWNKKIKYLIGIVCGHTPSKLMTDSLIWKSGHKREDVKNIRFRIKDENRPAWDYGVKIDFSDNSQIKSFGSDDFGFLFWRRFFSQKCCNYCSDVFANNADITFMDAWLPEYREKSSGTSMIICRNTEILNLLNELIDCGNIFESSLDNAVKSQNKLVEFKNNAGNHKDTEKLNEKIFKICTENAGNSNVIEMIRRLNYRENLKKNNKLLWILTEIKDRIFKL